MSQLEKYRKIVDDIDSQVVSLIERRMELSKRIGEVKVTNNLPIKNPEREKAIMEKNNSCLRDDSFCPQINELYSLILRQSYDIQKSVADSKVDK